MARWKCATAGYRVYGIIMRKPYGAGDGNSLLEDSVIAILGRR